MAAKYADLNEYYDYRGKRFAEKCTNCGLCLDACPVFPLTGLAEKGSQAVFEKITDLLKGGEVSPEAYEMVFSCNGACGACARACPEGLMPYSAFTSAVTRMAAAGVEPPRLSYQLRPGRPDNFASVFSALQIRPSEKRWIEKMPAQPDPADVVFFTGCIPSGIPHNILEIVAILEAMGLNFVTIPGGDICCGSGAMIWGDQQEALRLGSDLVSRIAAFGASKAVFFCHGCYVMCMGILPRFMSLPFQSYELAQFLVENIDRIPFKHRIDKTVTVHDSCAAARLGMCDDTRTLLRAVPGLRLVEMEHNRDEALCCGGLTNVNRPEISESLRRAPLEEARTTGADGLATICTGCQESFAPLEHEYGLEVLSYVNLVAESVGVRHEDRFKPLVNGDATGQVLSRTHEFAEANGFSRQEMERILPDYLDRFCLKHSR